jgi:hypothetical protein
MHWSFRITFKLCLVVSSAFIPWRPCLQVMARKLDVGLGIKVPHFRVESLRSR